MDWNLFWAAFGAIGSTVGSLVTAAAVVVAVRQYRAPLAKRLRISFTSAFTDSEEDSVELFCIDVANAGIRPVNISNIYLNTRKKNIVLNFAQFSIPGALPEVRFPVELQPEQKVTLFLDRVKLVAFFDDSLRSGNFNASTKLRVAVTDQTGGWHYHNTGCTIGSLVSSTTSSQRYATSSFPET